MNQNPPTPSSNVAASGVPTFPGVHRVTKPAPGADQIDFTLVPIEPLVQRYQRRDRLQRAARAEALHEARESFANDGTSYLNLPMLLLVLVCLGLVAASAWGVVKVVLALATLPLPLALGIPATVIAAAALLILGVRHISNRNEGIAA